MGTSVVPFRQENQRVSEVHGVSRSERDAQQVPGNEELISNTATALVVIPIAISASSELAVSPRPVLMAMSVACAVALLTPIATPANLMVMGPGAYRFGDYWKLGLPLLVLYGLVAVLLVPVFFPF